MTVFMCSGQGAQKPGMGADLLALPEVAATFELASDVMGIDLAHLACEGSTEEVNDAYNAQALTMAVSVGVGNALFARGLEPKAVVGFSLGQISALALAGALDEEAAFGLLRVRASAMARAAAETQGAMAALLGATVPDAEALCTECSEGQVLVAANHNCPGQVVISGEVSAVDRAQEAWASAGKRAARLNTAGAFHSPLMQSAADELAAYCVNVEFRQPRIPLVCNTDARPFLAQQAAERLAAQVVSPVLFEESVVYLASQGCARFVEAGFGGVLAGLVRRIDKTLQREKAGTLLELEALFTN